MKNSELLFNEIGKTLKEGRIQSYEFRVNSVDLINVTFLKFENWIRIVTTDEQTNISLEINNFEYIPGHDDLENKYPISSIVDTFPEFKKYIGKQLVGFKELTSQKNNNLSFGINFYFENGLNLIIHNQDYPIDKNEFIFENRIPNDLIEK